MSWRDLSIHLQVHHNWHMSTVTALHDGDIEILLDLLATEERFNQTEQAPTLSCTNLWVENDDVEWWILLQARNPSPPGGTARCLVLTSVRIERHTLVGNSSILECHYDLQGEPLYSVKWYKDGNEFFRYLPKDNPPKQVFPLSGVEVDVESSNATQVRLTKLTLASTGRYRCEVSAEAPSFQTVSDHGDMMTVAIPKEGPRIIGGRPRYQLGDTVRVNCTSGPSRPATQLTWFINGEQANQSYVVGPIRKPHRGFETVTLGLVFRAEPRHFKRGDLKLKCLATIATVYWRTNEESMESDKHHKSPALEMKDTDKSVADKVRASTGCSSSPGSLVCLVLARALVALAVTTTR